MLGSFTHLEFFEREYCIAVYSRTDPERSTFLDGEFKFVTEYCGGEEKPSK